MNETVNDLVEMLEQSELSRAEKIETFCVMVDGKKVLQSLKKKALMISTGLDQADEATVFAFGVLKLARPDLFVRPDEPEEK